MERVETELGKIYCQYNEEAQDFDKVRVVDCQVINEEALYTLHYLDSDYHITDKVLSLNHSQYLDLKRDWILLKSDGIISLSNIVSIANEFREIKDIVLIFFPNNKATGYPISDQPHVVARQGIDNIFDPSGGTVGVSISLTSLPDGYTLADFMANESVISSRLSHVYKVDTVENLSTVLNNDGTNAILIDLFDHQKQYLRNTNPDFNENAPCDCIDGYNNTLKGFIKNSGFLDDVHMTIGIMPVDFIPIPNQELGLDDKLLISVLYGGLRIDKATAIEFDYDIDFDKVKMKYFLIKDPSEKIWVIPYTSSPDEIDGLKLYQMNEERLARVYERLHECVKTYIDAQQRQSKNQLNQI